MILLEQFSSCIQMKLWLIILDNRRINLFPLSKFNITKMKNCSNHFKYRFLKNHHIVKKNTQITWRFHNSTQQWLFWKGHLLCLTDSNYIHSPSGSKVFFRIIYSIKFVTFGLVEIMKSFWASQLILLPFLHLDHSQSVRTLKHLQIRFNVNALNKLQTKRQYLRRCSTKKIKTMIVSFRIWYLANTGSLQQVSSNGCSRYSPTFIKLNFNKFTKAAAQWKPVKPIDLIDNFWNVNQIQSIQKIKWYKLHKHD